MNPWQQVMQDNATLSFTQLPLIYMSQQFLRHPRVQQHSAHMRCDTSCFSRPLGSSAVALSLACLGTHCVGTCPSSTSGMALFEVSPE